MSVNVVVGGVTYIVPSQGDNYMWGSGYNSTPGLTALFQALAASTTASAAASSANTPNTLVLRDGAGSFAAQVVTAASLVATAATITTLTATNARVTAALLVDTLVNTNASAIVAAGVIESNTGGFMFPDATIQTTAMLGSGASGRAAFWSAAHTVSSDANFAWDSTNHVLTLVSGTVGLVVSSTDSSGGDGGFVIKNTGGGFGVPTQTFRVSSTNVGQLIGSTSASFGLVAGLTLGVDTGQSVGIRINGSNLLTMSASELQVKALIESTTGGFKFPDTTTQTTAAALLLASVGSSPAAAGASVSGMTLTLQPADATHPGVVTTGSQTFAGAKTFSSTISGSIDGTAVNFSGALVGDVTGTQGATVLANIPATVAAGGTSGTTITSAVANSGSNVAYTLNTTNALSGSTYLLQIKTAGTAKFQFDSAGNLSAAGAFVSSSAAGVAAYQAAEGALLSLNGATGTTWFKGSTSTHGVLGQSNVTASGSNSAYVLDTVNALSGSMAYLTLNSAGVAGWTFAVGGVTFPDGSTQSTAAAGGGGSIVVAAVGSTPNNNAASVSGATLTLQPADGTHPGVVTSGTQTIGGAKTFSAAISASNLSGTNTGDITLASVGSSPAAEGASLSSQVLTLQPADATHPGVVTTGSQTFAGTKTFSSTISGSVSGTAADLSATLSIAHGGTGQTDATSAFNALAPSQTSNSGKFLTTNGTNTSWATNTGGITALTGDVTASGSGSVAATVALVGTSTAANVHAAEVLANAATAAATASQIVLRDANANTRLNALIAGWATTVTAGATTTLAVGSAQVQQFTGSTTQTVKLPDATTLVVGQAFRIINRSTGIVTVNDNGSSLVISVRAKQDCWVTVTAIGSAAGTWDAQVATDANTASAPVCRDSSGNFSAGTITASLTGTASAVSGGSSGNAAFWTSSTALSNDAGFAWDNTNKVLTTSGSSTSGSFVAISTDSTGNNITANFKNTGGSSGVPVVQLSTGSTSNGQLIGFGSASFGLVNGLNLSVATGQHVGVRVNTTNMLDVTSSGLSTGGAYVSTIASGSIAFQATEGANVSLNGATNTSYIKGNATNHNINALTAVADGSSAVGYSFDTNVALSNATSKLHVWKNGGTEKVALDHAGKIIMPEGAADAVVGVATLASGTVTVTTSSVKTASRIFLTHAGTAVISVGTLSVGTISNATSFVINSSNVADNDTVNWFIVN